MTNGHDQLSASVRHKHGSAARSDVGSHPPAPKKTLEDSYSAGIRLDKGLGLYPIFGSCGGRQTARDSQSDVYLRCPPLLLLLLPLLHAASPGGGPLLDKSAPLSHYGLSGALLHKTPPRPHPPLDPPTIPAAVNLSDLFPLSSIPDWTESFALHYSPASQPQCTQSRTRACMRAHANTCIKAMCCMSLTRIGGSWGLREIGLNSRDVRKF